MKVIFLGETAFPLGQASAQKSIYICKSIADVGVDITMVCKKSVLSHTVDFDPEGNFEGCRYIFTAGTPYKSNKFLIRNYNKIKGFLNEFKFIYKSRKDSRIDAAIIYSRSFLNIVLYWVYSRVFGFKTLVNYGELRSRIKFSNISLSLKINDYLFDRYVIYLVDGFLPISEYLIEYIKERKQNMPFLKVPPLCDFYMFDSLKKEYDSVPYFLYCGSLGYYEIVKFILDAYKNLEDNSFDLYLVVHGSSERMKILSEYIKENFKDISKIKIFSNLPYNELVELYNNAYALMIPLRYSVQDIARFPHKIGEYCATGRPIITTGIGEVNNYFEDGKSAYIASVYSVEMFAEKMDEAQANPEFATKVGLEARKIGLEHFNYKTYGKKFINLIESI